MMIVMTDEVDDDVYGVNGEVTNINADDEMLMEMIMIMVLKLV